MADNKDLEAPGIQKSEPKTFRYRTPKLSATHGMSPMVKSDILFSAVQTVVEGGENSLHSHTGMDGFWFVLSGRCRFYGTDDKLIGEFGKHDGVLIPRGTPYWFESVGDELLEILQVEAIDRRVKNTLIRHAPKKLEKIEIFKQTGESEGIETARAELIK